MTTESNTRDRAILPDALDEDRLVIIKACSALRLTQEIKLAAFASKRKGVEFILAIPIACRLDPDLAVFVQEHGVTIYRTE